MSRDPAPLLTRILIISAMVLIIAAAGLLVLLARSCGGDEPAPVAKAGMNYPQAPGPALIRAHGRGR